MSRISAQEKTLEALQRCPGSLKTQSYKKGNSGMSDTSKPEIKQTRKQRIIILPNSVQFEIPASARRLCRVHGISPHYAKLIAEKQGYKMGRAI